MLAHALGGVNLWTQLPLGPLRKNASVMTMRRTIKEHIRAHTA